MGENDSVYNMLEEKYGDAVSLVDVTGEPEGNFDYIICIGYSERVRDIQALLKLFKSHLTSEGCLILGMHNRLGIRYFCGDRDPYTERNLDGPEDYRRVYSKDEDDFAGRTYDRHQLESLLAGVGLSSYKFYSVFSGLEQAPFIFADGYIPNEDLTNRHFPVYHYPGSLFLDEQMMYRTLQDNGLFHTMANAYLIECPLNGECSDALQITSSLDRGRDKAIITIIHSDGTVTKQAAYPEGQEHIQELIRHNEMLGIRGVDVVDAHIENGIVIMPYIKADTGQMYLEKLLRTDIRAFLEKMDEFRGLILKSSDIHMGRYTEPEPDFKSDKDREAWLRRCDQDWGQEDIRLLKDGFIDMVPLNSMYIDDHFVFFDQEFCLPDLPVDVPVSRMIFTFFCGDPQLRRILDPAVLYDRYGVPDPAHTPGGNKYLNMEFRYFDRIMHRDILRDYYGTVRINADTLNSNRQRMNYSAEDYKRLFEDTFEGTGTRRLVLFGSGRFAKIFLTRYGHLYDVCMVIDNNSSRQGQKLYPEGYEPDEEALKKESLVTAWDEMSKEGTDDGRKADSADRGIMIYASEHLKTLKHGEYKVIICIKNYISVMKQLDAMGIYEYAIYDPGKDYRINRYAKRGCEGEYLAGVSDNGEDVGRRAKAAKYHVGYTPGAYDMFHIGHVNLLKKSKEMCDYLIVGVMSDEAIRLFKKKEPVIPYEQRAAVVASCRYVDEVVEIPYMRGQADEAWKLYHFDVLFCGSDYVKDEGRMREREFLESHGATIEIFPYTEGTSSSLIRDRLRQDY